MLAKVEGSKYWIGGGISNHVPSFLKIGQAKDKLLSPFKFKSHWLKDMEFLELVQNEWRHYDEVLEETTMHRFIDILKIIKKKTRERNGPSDGSQPS